MGLLTQGPSAPSACKSSHSSRPGVKPPTFLAFNMGSPDCLSEQRLGYIDSDALLIAKRRRILQLLLDTPPSLCLDALFDVARKPGSCSSSVRLGATGEFALSRMQCQIARLSYAPVWLTDPIAGVAASWVPAREVRAIP